MAIGTRHGEEITCRDAPCAHCPWRVDGLGKSPVEVFELGKEGKSSDSFGCHMAKRGKGGDALQICAGYLKHGKILPALRALRHMGLVPRPDQVVYDGPMFQSYDEMAAAHIAHARKAEGVPT